MSCTSHGYTNDVICPACDAESVKIYELLKLYPNTSFRDSMNPGTNFTYVSKIYYNSSIHEVLGKVDATNDGRFKWTRKRCKFTQGWYGDNEQGCCKTLNEAKLALLEGWI